MTDQKSGTVRLVEVGPRDGLQSLDYRLSIETRLEWITRLSQSGLSEIECGAFVRPDRVPAMASSDQLFTKIKNSDFLAWALVPNLKGLERAQNSGVSAFAFFTSATETFSMKNASCSRQDSLERFKSLVVAADSQPLRAYLSCCFSCPFEGEVEGSDVLYMTRELLDLGAHEIVISDTIGSATPEHVLQLTHQLNSELSSEVITSKISLHLHDTHGQAVESAHAGWEAGIRSFDGSAGGIGGCPFAPNASGNVSTESLVALFDQLGVATGVSTSSLTETANWFSNQPREIS